MTLRNFDEPLKNPFGEIVHELLPNGQVATDAEGKPKPITPKTAIVTFLLTQDRQKEPSLNLADARARGRLADKIAAGGNVDIDAVENSTVVDVLQKYSSNPLLTTRCLDALEKEIPN